MNPYFVLILLSVLVIFSYLFDMVSRRTQIPSVLLLLVLGSILRYVSIYLHLPIYKFTTILPLLGTVGLILIVFEGALELKFEPSKAKLIRSTFIAALFLLCLTSVAIAGLFYYFLEVPFQRCLLNAIPFSVISSAIAIPSVTSLFTDKKEFIIYESSFSDILGIMLFNLILMNETIDASMIGEFGVQVLIVSLISLISCFGFLFIMGRMKHHVKFFLIISALILVYAVGKQFHLSTLIVVLAFGLFLENSELIAKRLSALPLLKKVESIMIYPSLRTDLKGLHQLTAESAFLLRTFFFLVFGYSLEISELMQSSVFFFGSLTLLVVYLLRWIYLAVIVKAHLWPELVISPRGLISVLLFLSIPQEKLVGSFMSGLLLFIILASGLLMTIGLIATGKLPTESGDE